MSNEDNTKEAADTVVVKAPPKAPLPSPVAAPSTEVHDLHQRVHDLEETVHAFLSRQSSVGHEKISTWLDKVKARFHSSPSTGVGKGETAPQSSPATTKVVSPTSQAVPATTQPVGAPPADGALLPPSEPEKA